MKISGPKESILGIMSSGRMVQAVLIADTAEGPQVVRRFTRQRTVVQSDGMPAQSMKAEEGKDTGEDFTIEFGSAGAGSDLFLSSEFGVDAPEGGKDASGSRSPASTVVPFDLELTDILSECETLGHPEPLVAFCAGLSEVATVELVLPVPGSGKPKKDSKPSGKASKKAAEEKPVEDAGPAKVTDDRLIEMLKVQYEGNVDPERVAFLPLTDGESGQPRRLAIVSKGNDAVAATLSAFRARKAKMPAARLLDAEVPLYLGLARSAFFLTTSQQADAGDDEDGFASFVPSGPRKTLVVRAGLEDTLVMFLEDDRLHHYESLRSITTYDAPETICSRVLLLQDEYGIGDVQHVLLLSDDREEAIVESFKMFFTDTRVESLRSYVPKIEHDESDPDASSSTVLAVGVALRLVSDPLYSGSFEEINLLPKRLLRRQVRIPFNWHIFAYSAFLFVTALFFVGRFFAIEKTINEYREKIEQYPAEYMDVDPAVLQARVDSLNRVSEGYRRALTVLDSLLVGSDMWSRGLEKISTETAQTRGIWIDAWRPTGNIINLAGNATSRERIVQLSDRIKADIETVTFSEIREWPVYTFTMKVGLPAALPEAATYLREKVAARTEEKAAGTAASAVATN